jgi:hypothetical protein
VDYGTQRHGDEFFLNVKPKEGDPPTANSNGAVSPGAPPKSGAVPAQRRAAEHSTTPVLSTNGNPVENEDVSGRIG